MKLDLFKSQVKFLFVHKYFHVHLNIFERHVLTYIHVEELKIFCARWVMECLQSHCCFCLTSTTALATIPYNILNRFSTFNLLYMSMNLIV